MLKTLLLLIFVGTFALLFVSGCSEPKQKQTLKIGYTQEPPYSFISEQGSAGGMFPDLARKIAAELQYPDIEWVFLSFDSLIPALEQGRVDVVAAGMTITKARIQRVCFSDPVVSADSAYLFLANNKDITEDQPLSDQKLIFAALNGSIESAVLNRKVPDYLRVNVEDAYLGLLSLKQGKADVLLLTEPSLRELTARLELPFHIRSAKDLILDPQRVAFAFKQTEKSLVSQWNRAQRKLIEQADFTRSAKRLGMQPAFSTTKTGEACPRP